MTIDNKSFRGQFMLYRKRGQGMTRPRGDRGGRPPHFRHPTYDEARAEAERLLPLYPDSTFIILQEVGRVKLRTDDAEVAHG